MTRHWYIPDFREGIPGTEIVDRLGNLDIDDIARIALGATLLGAGGGGDPYISLLAARQLYADGGRPANVIRVSDLDDDAQVLCVAGFGAPTVEKERLFELPHVIHSIRTLEKHIGRKADALIAAEMGGCNALMPILAASDCDLPGRRRRRHGARLSRVADDEFFAEWDFRFAFRPGRRAPQHRHLPQPGQ